MLLIAACGGDSGEDATDGGDQPGATQGETTPPPADDDDGSEETTPPSDDAGDDSSDSEGSGPSTATVTIGDETYNFSTEGAVVAQCLTDLFGIFSVQLPMVDGDGSVAIVALREGTDPETVGEVNSVEVDAGDNTWVADEADDVLTQTEQFEPGMSQVDSVEIDGRTVRGTATFVLQSSLFAGGEVETMTGTFEATCGEERTS
jgi:hypothetical protein